MCGINGFNWKDEELARRMNATLRHRGPDDQGVYADNAVSLGQTRLSILDLSEKGHQPMGLVAYGDKKGNRSKADTKLIYKDKKLGDCDLIIVLDGEIYNHQEIRDDLKEFDFESTGDTEVILKSYLKWGEDCVNRFNGMWAFCLYDKKAGKLILSRDRTGRKPLFYYFDGDRFIFSSEIKGILQHKVTRKINVEALDFYFTIGFIPSPMSIYENIAKVESRQLITFDMKGKKINKKYYYQIPKYTPIFDKKKLIDEGKWLLEDATRLRLIADIPVGAFLSGGLDSSSVISTMSELTDPRRLHTFSIGFEGRYDEGEYMQCMKDYLHRTKDYPQTMHHHKSYTEKDFDNMLDKISYYYDEPFADFSNFPSYEVSKFARQHVTISFSGDGGDEIFGGYSMYRAAVKLEMVKRLPVWMRKAMLKIMPNMPGIPLFRQIRKALQLSLAKPEEFHAEWDSDLFYMPESFKKWSASKMKEVLKSCNNNFIEALLRYDLYYNTFGDNGLAKVDRASMANALEVRSPLLDYRFLEFETKIPVKWKVSSSKTKILMRDMIRGLVPDKIVNRTKQGFTPPIADWVKGEKYDEDIETALEKLHDEGIINNQWHKFFVERGLSGSNLVYRIRLLMLWKWWQSWM